MRAVRGSRTSTSTYSADRCTPRVRKLRRGMGRSAVWNKEQLVRDVMAAVKAYPASKLSHMWDYKSDIMAKVVEAKGGNDYERHRLRLPLFVTDCGTTVTVCHTISHETR